MTSEITDVLRGQCREWPPCRTRDDGVMCLLCCAAAEIERLRAVVDDRNEAIASFQDAIESLQKDRAALSDLIVVVERERDDANAAAERWRDVVSIYTSRFGAVLSSERYDGGGDAH